MTQLQFATDASPGGALISDDSARATALSFATNVHGFAELRSNVPMPLTEAFQRYDRAGLPHQRLNDGAGVVYEGRLEDLAINGDGVRGTALGYSRALSDAPYTALWSMSDVTQWRPVRTDEVANRVPELYQFDTNNRILIALNEGQTYGNFTDVGAMVYQKPEGGVRQIIGLSFDAVVTLPLNWIFELNTYQSGYAGATGVTVATGNGGVQPINKFFTFAGCDYVAFSVYNNTGGNYVVAHAPAIWSVKITNVRLVTSTANKVDTTTTANVLAGAGISVPVVSSARMYVGQRLHMGIPAAAGFAATVLTIPDSTHFTADLSAGMASGGNVQAHVIYADEIVRNVISTVSTLNPTQLSSSTTLIQSPALDLFNENYTDQYPFDILNRLITLGDNQATPREWEWAVWENRQLIFQPRGFSARTWYIDLAAPTIERSLNALANSVYADYQEPGGRTLRTTPSSDSASIARYGLARRIKIDVDSTSATQAGVQVAAALQDGKDPAPRAQITTEAVFDQNGARWPLNMVRANDICVIRNLPPTLGTAIDRVRIFRVVRTTYDAMTDTLTLEPESPLPSLTALLARAAAPAYVTTPWWVQNRQ